ncbi:MAG TPA: 30S ribosomal protein S7 [Candidatus Saccharimonadia bacterium]|jgi:small subunit ribosomal protein S7|nr:30S ribosomal protein S7 [Candidatus Saccharimonadia bacterium]
MPRKKTKSFKRIVEPDLKYGNVMVTKMINKVMRGGKKRLAESLVYGALETAETKAKQPALEIFEAAIKNVAPAVQVKAKRIGGATYQVPTEVRGDRKIHLAMTWILGAARAKSGKAFDQLLADELMNAYNNQGDAIKKREDTHRMAEANKAFAHFARY